MSQSLPPGPSCRHGYAVAFRMEKRPNRVLIEVKEGFG
jgi:hypothetical protein